MIEDELATVPAGDTRQNCGKPRQEQPLGQDVKQVGSAHAPVGAHYGDKGHGSNGMCPACNTSADARDEQQFRRSNRTGDHPEEESATGRPKSDTKPESIAGPPVEYVHAERGEHECDGEVHAHGMQRMAADRHQRTGVLLLDLLDYRIFLILRFFHARSPFRPITIRRFIGFRGALAFFSVLPLVGCTGDLSALDPAGPFAAAIADLWWLMLTGGAAIFLLVLALFLLVIFRPGSGRRISPSRWIWVGGVVFPLVTLVALIGHGLMRGEYILNLRIGGDPVEVEARGSMWNWEFRYTDGARASRGVLHIPVGRTVVVTATSEDVIHSFWAPRLGGKIDAIPGHAATVRILADHPGVYGGVCSEYCGTGHDTMRFEVHAHPAEAYDAVLAGLSDERRAAR